MQRIPVSIYSTPEEIEAIIRQLETDAMNEPPDSARHRNMMKQIAQFRIYADAKRWLAGPTKQHA